VGSHSVMMIGYSDSRTFYIYGTVNKYFMHPLFVVFMKVFLYLNNFIF
jgi:hypothetical protein